jgi:hypothetical protein
VLVLRSRLSLFAASFTFAVALVAFEAPVSAAPVLDGPEATLTIRRDNGTIVARYDLFNYASGGGNLAQRGLVPGQNVPDEEPNEDVETLDFQIIDRTTFLVGDVAFKEDPFVQYSFGISNFTSSALNYEFIFSTPFTGGPYTQLTASLSSSITDGGANPNGRVTVDPLLAESSVNGTPYLTLATQCSRTGTPGFSASCPNAMDATQLMSPATGILSVRVAFRLSARDLISLNGRTELINPRSVSEPATLAVLGIGLLGLLGLRRRHG